MSKLDKTEVLNAFEAAYEAAHGKKPNIETKPGWYSIDGGKNMRLADVAALTDALTSGSAPSEENTPAKKEVKKPVAVSTNVKKSSFNIIKENEDGYTAEEFWIICLAEKDHDCRLPRGVV